MLIPERSIEVWLGAELRRLLDQPKIWAPSQNLQAVLAGGEPWDLAVGTRKIFALEVKGLTRPGTSIPLWWVQHQRLLSISGVLPDLLYYALPAWTPLPVEPPSAFFTPPFVDWMRIAPIRTVDTLAQWGPTRTATTRGHISRAGASGAGWSLYEFMCELRACREGFPSSDVDRLRSIVRELGLTQNLLWVGV